MDPDNFLIWSNANNAWWRADSAGYSQSIDEAGIYSKRDAMNICTFARDGWGSDAIPSEIPVRQEDAIFCQQAYLEAMKGVTTTLSTLTR